MKKHPNNYINLWKTLIKNVIIKNKKVKEVINQTNNILK